MNEFSKNVGNFSIHSRVFLKTLFIEFSHGDLGNHVS